MKRDRAIVGWGLSGWVIVLLVGVAAPVPEALFSEPGSRLESQWDAILKSLSRVKGRRFNLGALLRDCKEREIADGVITLRFSHRSHMERMQEELEDPRARKALQETVTRAMDREYEIEVAAADGQRDGPRQSAAQRSHLVRAAQAMGAQVVGEKEEERE